MITNLNVTQLGLIRKFWPKCFHKSSFLKKKTILESWRWTACGYVQPGWTRSVTSLETFHSPLWCFQVRSIVDLKMPTSKNVNFQKMPTFKMLTSKKSIYKKSTYKMLTSKMPTSTMSTSKCQLTKCWLPKCRLPQCQLQNANFQNIDFQNADFQNVSFQKVDFQNVNFQNVDFQNV
jgi:hypothetical protein